MENKIIKTNGIEFRESELYDIYFNNNKHFIVKYKTIYHLKYSENTGIYAQEVYKNYKDGIGYTKKGRFIITNAKQVNELIGREVFFD